MKSIEKVLETFGDNPIGTPAKSPFTAKDVININEPVDFSALMAKSYISPFLTNKPSSQMNRVELLYDTLKKQKLI